jgi:RimK family alpha-L-glutamate ligase
MKAPKFKEFITEEKNKPYRLVILSHNAPDDPNDTGVRFREEAKKLGIKCFLAEMVGCRLEEDGDKVIIHSLPTDDKGEYEEPKPKEVAEYASPFVCDSKDTLVMVRSSTTYNKSWKDMFRVFMRKGFCIINPLTCSEICVDKWHTYQELKKHNLTQPKTQLITHKEDAPEAFKRMGAKYPIILKTITGTHGIGVILVESENQLGPITQILYKLDEEIDVLLQEYIPTEFDVRVILANLEPIAQMKRTVGKDFRSNVSQGAKALPIEITKLELEECIKAAKAVDGLLVGVDFIPSKNREKDPPYMLEVNSSPGFLGIEEATKKSVTKTVLEKYMNRDLWRTSEPHPGIYDDLE